jgi:pimeloyl-ACP methyl ester carboxylesterase
MGSIHSSESSERTHDFAISKLRDVVETLTFIPPTPSYTYEFPAQVIFIKTKGGHRIATHHFVKDDAVCTIIMSHGNAVDIGNIHNRIRILHGITRVNIVTYDYVGYGLSDKSNGSTEENTYECIESVLHDVKIRYNCENHDIILIGRSVGSAPTCEMIKRYNGEFAGVVLISPFTSIIETKVNVKMCESFDIFRNIDKIGMIKCPCIIYHGRLDKVVPFDHGRRLWSSIPQQYGYRYKFVDHKIAGHNNIIQNIFTFSNEIKEFIEHCQTIQSQKTNAIKSKDS